MEMITITMLFVLEAFMQYPVTMTVISLVTFAECYFHYHA